MYFIYFFTNILVKISYSIKNVYTWKFLYDINIYNKNVLNSFDKKKDVYILGTGSSVNDISGDEWLKIKNNFTIGLNKWFIHDVITDVIQLELISDDPDYLANLNNILSERKELFNNTVFIIKNNYLKSFHYKSLSIFLKNIPLEIKNKMYFVIDFPIPGRNPIEFKKSIIYLNYFNFFKYNTSIIGQARSSLGFSILNCIKMGFKSINLIGVDLHDSKHFYETNKYYVKKYKTNQWYVDENISNHLTNDKSYFELTIIDAIKIINSKICNKYNVKLFIGSKKSKLFPYLQLSFSK